MKFLLRLSGSPLGLKDLYIDQGLDPGLVCAIRIGRRNVHPLTVSGPPSTTFLCTRLKSSEGRPVSALLVFIYLFQVLPDFVHRILFRYSSILL